MLFNTVVFVGREISIGAFRLDSVCKQDGVYGRSSGQR